MIRLFRAFVLSCLVLLVLLAGFGFLWFRHEKNRDPMPLLDRGPVFYRVLRENWLWTEDVSGSFSSP
jgi:hypothetical protein